MAEAHQPLAAGQGVADPRLGLVGRADLAELVDDLRRRAAVERPLHRPDRPDTADARSERVEVMTRAVNVEALKPVLRADDEVRIEGAGRAGIRPRSR